MTTSLQRMSGTRIVAAASALDRANLSGSLLLRFAPDEAFVLDSVSGEHIDDPYAIVVPDCSFVGLWLESEAAINFLQQHCEWQLPTQRPAFAQGMVAGLAMKLWFEPEKVLLMVPAPFESDFSQLCAETV